MDEVREFYFVAEVEGEEARSDDLTIAKDLKKCDILEIADVHFNHDSAVLLPLRQALNAIACCYMFIMENPSKLMLIAGHCDKSGNPPYNEWLGKKRAENVLNIMLGKREEWVKSVTTPSGPIQKKPDGKSKHEDYQMILKWIFKKYGWPCDPCDVEDGHPCDQGETKKAVTAFQENWNDDAKLRSYVNASPIKVDGLMGPETWGAFFDIYMIELADLLELHSDTSRLGKYRKACKFVDDNKKTISSGESHAHSPDDISLEDRKVYIMFFDPNETPKLDAYPDCHKGVGDKILGDIKDPSGRGAKRSEECELFRTKNPYRRDRVSCPRPRSPFLILFPALGLPAIADNGAIDVIALVERNTKTLEQIKQLFDKKESEGSETEENKTEIEQLLQETIVRALRYANWSQKDKDDGSGKKTQIDFDTANKLQPSWIEDMKWIATTNESTWAADEKENIATKKIELKDEDGIFLCSHELILHASDKTFAKYETKYQTAKVFRFHIELPDADGLYNLVNQFDESQYVRNLLKGLKSPGKHATEKAETTIKKGSEIIVYHPFLITKKDFLSVAHVTDTHVSTLWDKLESTIKSNSIMSDGDFNNYNTRLEDILKDLSSKGKNNAEADMLVVTGDLIDYNRGYVDLCRCGGASDHLLNDYLYNRNWVLFYELLVANYEKPVFTVVGNHEYLLNPYPLFIYPTITWFWGKLDITEVISYILNMRLTQSPFAVDQNLTKDEDEKLAKLVNSTDRIKLSKGEAIDLLSKMGDRDEEALGKLVESTPDGRTKLHDIDRGTWYCYEECVLWYFLVINPFKDYSFRYKEMTFLMVDWNVFQDKRDVLLLPRPTNCLYADRMRMVDELGKTNAKYRIFCSHAPIIDPWPELGDFYMVKAWMKKNHDDIGDYPLLDPSSEKLWWGALEEGSRIALVSKILSLPIHLSLCGHSHKNKVFQIEETDNQKLAFLRRDEKGGTWDSKSPLIVVTTSAGPFGRTSEVGEWEYSDLIPAGYRIVTFAANGQISTKLVDVGVAIREKIKQDRDLMKNDFGKTPVPLVGDIIAKVLHDIDKVKKFDSSIKLKSDHSTIIEEVSGSPTITSLDDGRTIVIKKVPSGATVNITGNDGTIVIQRNEGKIVIKDNDDIIDIDQNLGQVSIDQNDDNIVIHENGDPKTKAALSGLVDINSNGHNSPGTDIVRIFDNYGTVQINQSPHGNNDLVDLRRNYGTFQIGYNNDTVEVGLNKGNVQIVNNTNGAFKDSEIFIYKNENTIDIYGNQGNIYVFDNANNGKIDVKDNGDTIKVNSSRAGAVTGAKSKSVKYESESDLNDKFGSRDQAKPPPIDDSKRGP